jgi:large subunit ribosomal protein L28
VQEELLAFPDGKHEKLTASLEKTRTVMSKVCSITGSKVSRGSVIHRRGMAKKKGGVGRHVTKNVPRTFTPNLHEHRIWVPELRKFVRVKLTARGLKTVNKNGAFRTLKKAGLVSA